MRSSLKTVTHEHNMTCLYNLSDSSCSQSLSYSDARMYTAHLKVHMQTTNRLCLPEKTSEMGLTTALRYSPPHDPSCGLHEEQRCATGGAL